MLNGNKFIVANIHTLNKQKKKKTQKNKTIMEISNVNLDWGFGTYLLNSEIKNYICLTTATANNSFSHRFIRYFCQKSQ